jgi:hypothetical protein
MLAERVILSPEAMFQEISGEGVILDLASASYFGLDGVGVRLWMLLQSDPSLQLACEALLAEYEVERTQLEDDLTQLVRELANAGLVRIE